jgi:soluble lytic murein transglycosylase-like protein
MKIIQYFKNNWILMSSCFLIGVSLTYLTVKPKKHDLEIHKNIDKDLPPSLRVYYYCNFYSDSLNIPINYMYGIASTESGWQGPFDFKYNPSVKSSVGALGPMQIMPGTAKIVLGRKIQNKKLLKDIQLNVKISALLLKQLYSKYGDWKVAFGAYNTGKPIINKYSEKVFNYEPNWSDSVIVNLNNE